MKLIAFAVLLAVPFAAMAEGFHDRDRGRDHDERFERQIREERVEHAREERRERYAREEWREHHAHRFVYRYDHRHHRYVRIEIVLPFGHH